MRFLLYLKACAAVYRLSKKGGNGVIYTAVLNNGVPELVILVGSGREAWRISQLATETFVTGAQ